MASDRGESQIFEPWKDPSAKPFIQFENVVKKFGDFVAVNNVSLDIYKGELFSLLGGSGCGKTTLLRMLAGFETPSSGRILLDGQDVSGIPPYERPINMMFQSYALFPHMSVESNVAFGLKQDGLPAHEITRRVEEMLNLVHLGEFCKRKPHQLSGGQRQRVALARALAKKPKVLLLDEPLSALDKKLREQTQFELVNIQESVGVTFVIVTHDQGEAMTMSTRLAVMNKGRIIQVGTPQEIYEYPASKFVADFIGTANMFEAQLVDDVPNSARLKTESGIEFVLNRAVEGPEFQWVTLALRPEKIRIAAAPPPVPDNSVSGTVAEIAYLGNLSIYHVKLPDGKIVEVTQANLNRYADQPFRWGDTVYLSWEPGSPVVLRS